MKAIQEFFEELDRLLETGEYNKMQESMNEARPANIAEYLEEKEPVRRLFLFRLLTKDMAAEVFSYMEKEAREQIVEAVSDAEVRLIVDELFLDDTVDFLEEAPANLVKKVLRNTEPEKRGLINRFLNYPEDSAGSIMTVEYVTLKAEQTAEEAIERIRKTGMDRETVYTCYVLDNERHLTGVVPLRTLLCADGGSSVGSLMEEEVVSVQTEADREEAAEIFKKYNWNALPVTDRENRLVGIITVDDIMDVIEEETTEDMEKMAAVVPSEKEYLKTGVFSLAKHRLVWLSVLMLSGTLSSFVIQRYENLLNAAVVLTGFMTIITDTGGNAGSQTSALIIRGIALGEIRFRDTFRVFWKELRVGILCGGFLLVLNLLRMTLFSPATEFPVDLTVSLSMAATVVLAKSIGCLLPLFAKAVHLDPAMMAGPLITTIVDALALMIYFSIAGVMLL